jgi:nucleoid-associated protein YgaU
MPKDKGTEFNSKDNLAFVIGGIFILGLVFATYTYFNKTPDILEENGAKTENSLDKIKEMISNKLGGEDEKEGVEAAELDEESVVSPDMLWVATDYQEGDIGGDTHTVLNGDTLWEIAEAAYGDGFEWVKILEANADSIGYLPDGSQALIVPGQVLVLP